MRSIVRSRVLWQAKRSGLLAPVQRPVCTSSIQATDGKGRGGEKSPAPGPGGTWVITASPRTPPRARPRLTSTIHMTCIATSSARSRFHQLGAQAGQGAALQPGDVHLGEADPGCDLILVQVLEEPQQDDLTFQLWQGGDQARQGQQIFRFLPGARRRHQVPQRYVPVLADWLVQGHLKAAARSR